MKALIEVADRAEAKLIREGLQDREARALVKIQGALSRLPSLRAKVRALQYVADVFNERDRKD